MIHAVVICHDTLACLMQFCTMYLHSYARVGSSLLQVMPNEYKDRDVFLMLAFCMKLLPQQLQRLDFATLLYYLRSYLLLFFLFQCTSSLFKDCLMPNFRVPWLFHVFSVHHCQVVTLFFVFSPLMQRRDNAQPSCAGLFIHSHLPKSYAGAWIHVDMAGPVHQVSYCCSGGYFYVTLSKTTKVSCHAVLTLAVLVCTHVLPNLQILMHNLCIFHNERPPSKLFRVCFR